jgi:hypothetical protein
MLTDILIFFSFYSLHYKNNEFFSRSKVEGNFIFSWTLNTPSQLTLKRDGYLQCDEFYSALKSNKLIIHCQRVILCELFISNIKRVIEWAEKKCAVDGVVMGTHDCHCFISDYLPMKSHKIFHWENMWVGYMAAIISLMRRPICVHFYNRIINDELRESMKKEEAFFHTISFSHKFYSVVGWNLGEWIWYHFCCGFACKWSVTQVMICV